MNVGVSVNKLDGGLVQLIFSTAEQGEVFSVTWDIQEARAVTQLLVNATWTT